MRGEGEREDRPRLGGPRAGPTLGGGGSLLVLRFAVLAGTDPTRLLDAVTRAQVDKGAVESACGYA